LGEARRVIPIDLNVLLDVIQQRRPAPQS